MDHGAVVAATYYKAPLPQGNLKIKICTKFALLGVSASVGDLCTRVCPCARARDRRRAPEDFRDGL